MDDLKNKRRHWNLKEKALVSSLRRTRCVRDYGPVATTAYAVKSSTLRGIKTFNV